MLSWFRIQCALVKLLQQYSAATAPAVTGAAQLLLYLPTCLFGSFERSALRKASAMK